MLFSSIFLPALIAVGAIVGGFFLLYQIFNTTIRLDSGPGGLIVDIVCSLAGTGAPSGASNSKLAAGKCVYQLLSKFGINPLTESNAVGAAFNSFSAGLGNGAAAAEAARSATSYKVFQCVGFDVVVDIMTGGAGWGGATPTLPSPPSGYKPVFGVGSCSPGDFFVDTSGAVGHTGILSAMRVHILNAWTNGGG